MPISKEKNFIIIAFNDKNEKEKSIKIDINDNTIYGIKGKSVKCIAPLAKKEIRNTYCTNEPKYDYRTREYSPNNLTWYELALYIQFYNDWWTCNADSILSIADKVNNLNIPIENNNYENKSFLDYLGRNKNNIKFFIKFFNDKTMKEQYEVENDNSNIVKVFNNHKNDIKFSYINPFEITDTFTVQMARDITEHIDKEYWNNAKWYYDNGLYEFFNMIGKNPFVILNEYYSYCKKLDIKPNKNKNFIQEYTNVKRSYEIRKNEIDNHTIETWCENTKDKLYYENENFVIVMPKSVQDFVEEGTRQNNCVARLYLPKVLNKETNVVFVRKKDNPTKNYITCEVTNRGRILQYLLPCNQSVKNDTIENDFRQEYQKFLSKVWDF